MKHFRGIISIFNREKNLKLRVHRSHFAVIDYYLVNVFRSIVSTDQNGISNFWKTDSRKQLFCLEFRSKIGVKYRKRTCSFAVLSPGRVRPVRLFRSRTEFSHKRQRYTFRSLVRRQFCWFQLDRWFSRIRRPELRLIIRQNLWVWVWKSIVFFFFFAESVKLSNFFSNRSVATVAK